MTEEKTIKLSDYFGEKEYTLKEFQKRWSSPVNEIWAFLIDHGEKEERDLGQKLAEKIFPKVAEKRLTNFMKGKKNEHTRSFKNSRRAKQALKDAGLGLWYTGGRM
jgi:hypothetical protein